MSFDWILVGGGLQSGLLALALLDQQPATKIAMIERGPNLGGNHTWCFHAGDVPAAAQRWLEPLVAKRWPAYEVRFDGLTRIVEQPYGAVTSSRFAEVVQDALERAPGCELFLQSDAQSFDEDHVLLADGRKLDATLVVDARGPERPPAGTRMAYQIFVGLDVELSAPSGLEHPLLIDAEVEQFGGFRFLYLIPWDDHRLLAEETFFSAEPELDVEQGRARVLEYLEERGYPVAEVERQEHGVLPMPWQSWHQPPKSTGPLVAGYRGGFFHPGTGYSFGPAARLAHALAQTSPGPAARAACRKRWRAHEQQASFVRLLNRMGFCGWPPEDWWRVFRWFHRLPDDVIRRFYGLELSTLDRTRILVGKLPLSMSVWGALKG